MTITVTGPDGSTFDFPDGSTQEFVGGVLRNHYAQLGQQQQAQQAAQDAADKPIGGQTGESLSALTSLPLIGAGVPKAAAWMQHLARGGTTAENQARIQGEMERFQQAHPVRSTFGNLAVGSLPYMAAGEFAVPAKLLGMTGGVLPSLGYGAASGGVIGGADAALRGQNPLAGAAEGAAGSVAGLGLGHALGGAWNAVRGLAPRTRVPYTIDAGGTPVQVSESVVTRDPRAGAGEQDLLGAQHPVATAAEAKTKADMAQAHDNFAQQVNPNQTPGMTPTDAGQGAVNDLIDQEVQRAKADEARILGAAQSQTNIRQGFGGLMGGTTSGMSAQDIAQGIGQRIRQMQQNARDYTNRMYAAFRQQDAAYNPANLTSAGRDIANALNTAPSQMRVRLSPDVTPNAMAAVNGLDEDISHYMNQAALKGRNMTPDDMEEVRKGLLDRLQAANSAARAPGGSWQDAAAMRRVINEYDNWVRSRADMPGGLLRGNAQDVIAAQDAARQAHATERGLYSRAGPGDVVGNFMENVLGRYSGQAMSAEKIVSSLFGKAGGAPPENAAPILAHLRDRVFGANSPEWSAIKSAMVDHLTQTAPGMPDIPLSKQADNIERFLNTSQHADALYTPSEQAQLQQHADTLRQAEPAPIGKTQTEQKIAQLSGRKTGQAATGDQLISELFGQHGPAIVNELQNSAPQAIPALKEQLFRKVTSGPPGAKDWGSARINTALSNFANTPLARQLYTPNEIAMMRSIAQAHAALLPLPRTANTSGSAYTGARMVHGLTRQFMRMIGGAHGIPGLVAAEALAMGGEHLGAIRAQRRAQDLFLGRQVPLAPGGNYPQRVGGLAGTALTQARRGRQ